MKYWAYLNDDVSQKSYTEDELQQIPGFGPDILICSETSAVSQNPEWKPAKEVLLCFRRPKAPDFSKFRPKPPVPVNQEPAQPLPVPEVLPVGVNTTPNNQNQINQNNISAGLDATLLAQIKTLTDKIASLEGKIKEGSGQNEDDMYETDVEETFVSEPQNDQEDDVLEVPFDNDFEVPFDVNKSSEEIASEAEALLAKRDTIEIEEFDSDDHQSELINYHSDVQKILEDTIRESNFYPEKSEDKGKEKDKKPGKITIIAEDLISRTKLNFSEKTEINKNKEAAAEQKTENKENVSKEQPVNNNAAGGETEQEKPVHNEEKSEQNENSGDILEENQQNISQEEELKSLQALLIDDKEEEKPNELIEESKPEEESTGESKTEDKTENIPQEDIAEGPAETEKAEESSEEIHQEKEEQKTEDISVQEMQEDKPEENLNTEESTEEEQPKLELVPLDIAPEGNGGDSEHIEEQPEPELVSVDVAPEGNGGDSEHIEEQTEPELVSVDVAPEGNGGEPAHTEEIQEEIKEEEKQPEPVVLTEDTDKTQEEEHLQGQTLNIAAVEDDAPGLTEQLQLNEEPEANEEVEHSEEINDLDINNQIFNSIAEKVEVPTEENNNPAEQTANLSMTQGVTISEDDTTAAVLNEIAEEKAQQETTFTTSDKLFAELENTYRNEEAVNKAKEIVLNNEESKSQEIASEVNLDPDLAKEDEFLRTFTTSVEEVFLDQPTAIISDYVPPSSDNSNHGQTVLPDGVKREKPSDIKTVPLVPEAMGEEIYSSPYVESATAKLGRKSVFSNLVKWVFVVLLIAIMVIGALSALAVMGIINEKLSPIHSVIYSLHKTPEANTKTDESDFAPEMIDQNETSPQKTNDIQNQTNLVIGKVKGYNFPDGTTLEGRINSVNKNLSDEIEWNLFLTEEENVYSIAVKIPRNANGQGFSYRFNYNLTQNNLTPTTSEAKNIMENYSR